MKKIFIYVIILLSTTLSATEQIKDKVIYDGHEYELYNYLLRPFFKEHPELYPKSNVESTDLWRGYIAKFLIIRGRMYLSDLTVRYSLPESEGSYNTTIFITVLEEIFDQKTPVLADWLDSEFLFVTNNSLYRRIIVEQGIVVVDKDVPAPSRYYIKENDVNVIHVLSD